MGRIAGVPNKVTAEIKKQLQKIIEGVINEMDIRTLDTNQKIKLLQIALQYSLPRLKSISEQRNETPLEYNINIVKTRDELERLDAVSAYEAKHNVKIF